MKIRGYGTREHDMTLWHDVVYVDGSVAAVLQRNHLQLELTREAQVFAEWLEKVINNATK
jgi:hypothetical protein